MWTGPKRLFREPLLHFALLGATLFGAYYLGHGRERDVARIVVTNGQMTQLVDSFSRLRQRAPTDREIDDMIEQTIRMRVMAKEAVALGLDRDDPIVQRRLTQKFEFLLESTSAADAPTERDLELYLLEHIDRYRIEREVAFRTIFFNAHRPRSKGDSAARNLLAQLKLGQVGLSAATGDPFLLGNEFALTPHTQVARLFGARFAEALDAAPLDQWVGPIQSDYGFHLILARTRVAERLPSLDEIRTTVVRDWTGDRARALVDATYRELRAGYAVVLPPNGRDIARAVP